MQRIYSKGVQTTAGGPTAARHLSLGGPQLVSKNTVIVARHSVFNQTSFANVQFMSHWQHFSASSGMEHEMEHESEKISISTFILDHSRCNILPSCYCKAPKPPTAAQCARSAVAAESNK